MNNVSFYCAIIKVANANYGAGSLGLLNRPRAPPIPSRRPSLNLSLGRAEPRPLPAAQMPLIHLALQQSALELHSSAKPVQVGDVTFGRVHPAVMVTSVAPAIEHEMLHSKSPGAQQLTNWSLQ